MMWQGVIPMQQQLNYFREYKARIEKAIGEKKAKELINKASFLISCGTNDYVVNYFNNPIMQINYTVSAYQKFLLDNAHQLLKVSLLNLFIIKHACQLF